MRDTRPRLFQMLIVDFSAIQLNIYCLIWLNVQVFTHSVITPPPRSLSLSIILSLLVLRRKRFAYLAGFVNEIMLRARNLSRDSFWAFDFVSLIDWVKKYFLNVGVCLRTRYALVICTLYN